jgi:hypothetical protein
MLSMMMMVISALLPYQSNASENLTSQKRERARSTKTAMSAIHEITSDVVPAIANQSHQIVDLVDPLATFGRPLHFL